VRVSLGILRSIGVVCLGVSIDRILRLNRDRCRFGIVLNLRLLLDCIDLDLFLRLRWCIGIFRICRMCIGFQILRKRRDFFVIERLC